MPGVQYGPLLLSPEKATEIMDRVVKERVEGLIDRALQAYPDGLLLGMKKLPARERFAQYVVRTDYQQDLALLMNPEYPDQFKLGLAPAPVSSFWLQVIGVPELWHSLAKDFRELAKEYLEPK